MLCKIFLFPLLFIFVLYLKDFCSCSESFYGKKKKNPLKHRLDFHIIHFPSHPGSHLTLSLGIPWQSSHCQVPGFGWGTKTPLVQFSSVQSLSRVQLFATPWTAVCQASLSITNSQSLLKLMSIEPVMPSNHLIICHPLLLPPSISQHQGLCK